MSGVEKHEGPYEWVEKANFMLVQSTIQLIWKLVYDHLKTDSYFFFRNLIANLHLILKGSRQVKYTERFITV